MPSRRVSSLGVARLQQELANKHPKPSVTNSLKQAVGRLVVGSDLLDRLATLPEAGNTLLGIDSIRPAVRYLSSRRIKQIRKNGITFSDPRLALPADQGEKGIIRDPEILLTAIRRSPKLDAGAIDAAVTVAVHGIQIEKVHGTAQRYHVNIMVEDTANDFYDDGYLLRGERSVLGPLENSDFQLNPLKPGSEPPLQAITVAEAHIRHKSPEVHQEVITMLSSYVSKEMSETVEVNYLSLITEA